jgi:hypothetical protein
MAVEALRGPSKPAAVTARPSRQVSRYQPPSGCGTSPSRATSAAAVASFGALTRPPPA